MVAPTETSEALVFVLKSLSAVYMIHVSASSVKQLCFQIVEPPPERLVFQKQVSSGTDENDTFQTR